MSAAPEPTAAAIVGLLAEEDRLRVAAALVLGSSSLEEVAATAGLEVRRASAALERLAAGGLVEQAPGGGLQLVVARIKQAAQAEAKRRAEAQPEDGFGDVGPEAASVLRNFVSGTRLRQIPATRAKRLVVLDWLAGRFEPGRTYPERDVNLMLGMAHPDVAALRRYLVDEQFLERRDGFYWRAGGTFDV